MLTREQKYAADIFEKLSKIQKNEREKVNAKKYGAMAHQLPILIRRSGLAQALHFVDSRKGDTENLSKDRSLQQLLDDLAQTVELKDGNALVAHARNATLSEYMRLTQRVMAALLWYKRFAQSLLDIDAASANQ